MPLQTVHTKTFEAAAKQCGPTEREILDLESMLAQNPEAGDAIQGSGRCHKVRMAGRSKGKSGGYRVITFYSGPAIPVYLLYIYSQGARDNLSDSQVSALKAAAKAIVDAHKKKPARTIRIG